MNQSTQDDIVQDRECCLSGAVAGGCFEQTARIHAGSADVQQVVSEILAAVEAFDLGAIPAIAVATTEALTNAVVHGSRGRPDAMILVKYEVTRHLFRVRITDEGLGFDLDSLRDPTSDENLDLPNGRGVLLMRQLMDQVRYNRRGNSVELVKQNEPEYVCGELSSLDANRE